MTEQTYSKSDIEKAVAEAMKDARSTFDDEVEGLKAKNKELLAKVRAAKDIDPADLSAAEDRAEKAEASLADAQKQVKALTAERDKAVKLLEVEQSAARSYALDAELASAIAEGNVIPSLVPGFKAMMAAQAKADLVDGKYSVMIGDKPARDAIKAMLDSDDGKAWRAASHNSGGGAPGGDGGKPTGKTMARSDFDALSQPERASFIRDGGKPVDVAA